MIFSLFLQVILQNKFVKLTWITFSFDAFRSANVERSRTCGTL